MAKNGNRNGKHISEANVKNLSLDPAGGSLEEWFSVRYIRYMHYVLPGAKAANLKHIKWGAVRDVLITKSKLLEERIEHPIKKKKMLANGTKNVKLTTMGRVTGKYLHEI